MFGTCSAVTQKGIRCTSDAHDASGQCEHHARLARILSLANKTTSPSSGSGKYDTGIRFEGHSPSRLFPQPLIRASSKYEYLLLDGEQFVSYVMHVYFCFPNNINLQSVRGTLVITSYRMIFEPEEMYLRSVGNYHAFLDNALKGMPCASIAKLSYAQIAAPNPLINLKVSSSGPPSLSNQIVIAFKTLHYWILAGDAQAIMTQVNRAGYFHSPLEMFAFTGPRKLAEITKGAYDTRMTDRNHHALYDVSQDFARMGVDLYTGNAFRLSNQNDNYKLCPTYPREFVVPAGASDEDVAMVAEFRSKGRLPICCFVHSQNTASIWRCAQPKRGIFNASNSVDDQYLMQIYNTNMQSGTRKLWIADCRPELNARVNKFTGGGTESSSISHIHLSFLNIANIHAIRDSLNNVRQLAHASHADTNVSWWARVEETKWLEHIRLILLASLRVANGVGNEQTTVMVHCSDGWDRTAQICSLSQILLDGHYRTLLGLIQLIEKEWLRAGHKFQDRVGLGLNKNDEESPIFLQFLDCVWQLWHQYPTYFEFAPRLLEEMADAITTGQHGTFIGNCDQDRAALSVAAKTHSLWTVFLCHDDVYKNPFYRSTNLHSILLPPESSLLRQVTLWMEYYFRGATYETFPRSSTNPNSKNRCMSNNTDDLLAAMTYAHQHIAKLERELQQRSEGIKQSEGPSSLTESSLYGLHIEEHTLENATSNIGIQRTPVSPDSPLFPSAASGHNDSVQSDVSWRCRICSKMNSADAVKCVICGRPV